MLVHPRPTFFNHGYASPHLQVSELALLFDYYVAIHSAIQNRSKLLSGSTYISASSSTASSIVATLLPSSFSLFFLSALVTSLLGVIGVSGVRGIYGLYGVIGTPVIGVRRL